MKIQARFHAHHALETKRNGCHFGYGKHKGTKGVFLSGERKLSL